MEGCIRVRFNRPSSGWLSLTISSADRELSFTFSDTPYDSLLDLTRALHALVVNGAESTVRLSGEPEEIDLRFNVARPDTAELRATRWPDGRRVRGAARELGAFDAPVSSITREFWRALRRLETEFLDAPPGAWRFAFPSEEVAQLGAVLRQRAP